METRNEIDLKSFGGFIGLLGSLLIIASELRFAVLLWLLILCSNINRANSVTTCCAIQSVTDVKPFTVLLAAVLVTAVARKLVIKLVLSSRGLGGIESR